MLTRNASPTLRAWKYGLALPVFALLFLFACQKTGSEQADTNVVTGQTPIDQSAATDKDIFEVNEVERLPQFPGEKAGGVALMKFLSENIRYPDAAKKESAEGMEVITFVVDENGAVTKVESIKSDRQDFQDEAIRVVQSMPNWEPALGSDGKPVKVKLTLPIKFKLK